MPQLVIGTFPSQVFWVLFGFLAVYLLVSKVIAPNIEETFENRSVHLSDLLKISNSLKNEADSMKREAEMSLEMARTDAVNAECALVAEFKNRAAAEKDEFCAHFSEQSCKASEQLSKTADKVFVDINGNIDAFVDVAIEKLSQKK